MFKRFTFCGLILLLSVQLWAEPSLMGPPKEVVQASSEVVSTEPSQERLSEPPVTPAQNLPPRQDTTLVFDNPGTPDSIRISGGKKNIVINPEIWIPNSQKSLWYAVAIPGMGQIYNRKYWKLPIVYGGVAAIVYAISWNSRYYTDYSNAYRDFLDTDPSTNRYLDMVPTGYPESQYENYLSSQKDSYRRNRDLSIIAGIGFYAITIIDAFVDAELAEFDISEDLTMTVAPTYLTTSPVQTGAFGCGVSLNF